MSSVSLGHAVKGLVQIVPPVTPVVIFIRPATLPVAVRVNAAIKSEKGAQLTLTVVQGYVEVSVVSMVDKNVRTAIIVVAGSVRMGHAARGGSGHAVNLMTIAVVPPFVGMGPVAITSERRAMPIPIVVGTPFAIMANVVARTDRTVLPAPPAVLSPAPAEGVVSRMEKNARLARGVALGIAKMELVSPIVQLIIFLARWMATVVVIFAAIMFAFLPVFQPSIPAYLTKTVAQAIAAIILCA